MKALHLQKQQKKTSLDEETLGDKLSSDAWFTSNETQEGRFTDRGAQFAMIKRELLIYHDDTSELSLKTLVNYWNDRDCLTSLVAPTIPFEYCQTLYGIAGTAVELGDYHAAKTCLLAAGLLNQFRVTSYQEIFDFVDQKDSSDEHYEEQLSKTLPLCFDVYEATKTPESMKIFLEELESEGKIEELKNRVAQMQPLIDVVLKTADSGESTVKAINSLIPLNVLLTNYGKVKLTSVRVKHNEKRLFLSSSGRKSLSTLGIVSNDVFYIEKINDDTSVGVDITNLNIGNDTAVNGTSKRSKRKSNKKKGKGKGKK